MYNTHPKMQILSVAFVEQKLFIVVFWTAPDALEVDVDWLIRTVWRHLYQEPVEGEKTVGRFDAI